ncbi:hypothetical protein Q428_15025, partial [Fervidicella metallireducens AeB]
KDWHTYYVSDSSVLVHNKCTGSYSIKFKSGKTYHGKGPLSRAKQSARRLSRKHGDDAVKIKWKPAANNQEAFIDEYRRLRFFGGPEDIMNYNMRHSPGRKLYYSRYGHY